MGSNVRNVDGIISVHEDSVREVEPETRYYDLESEILMEKLTFPVQPCPEVSHSFH